MKIMGFNISRLNNEARASVENPAVAISSDNVLSFFGISKTNLPAVTVESALSVPAFAGCVSFLSRTLASLPLHAYKSSESGSERLSDKLQKIVHENPNGNMDSFKFRQYFWRQVFTGGRGLAWIERTSRGIEAIWPMPAEGVTIRRTGLEITYGYNGNVYPAEDVIDIPFMLKDDQISSWSPTKLASKAINLAIAMNDYGANFFAGGGVPPLVLSGPMPANTASLKRAMDDVYRSVEAAKSSDKPIFPIPSGHELKPVGIDPAKGQMTEARRFQVIEIARVFGLPPVFLQDFADGVKANAEQQDLHLVKHLVSQWATALEGEMNLKLFGRFNNNRFVEHNLDGLLRGDFKTRMDALAQGVTSGIMTPNEARTLENRPRHDNEMADDLFIQGATVPLDKAGGQSAPAIDLGNNGNGGAAQ